MIFDHLRLVKLVLPLLLNFIPGSVQIAILLAVHCDTAIVVVAAPEDGLRERALLVLVSLTANIYRLPVDIGQDTDTPSEVGGGRLVGRRFDQNGCHSRFELIGRMAFLVTGGLG